MALVAVMVNASAVKDMWEYIVVIVMPIIILSISHQLQLNVKVSFIFIIFNYYRL